MKLGFHQQEIINTAKSLGLPTDGFIQRRVARAVDILDDNKVTAIDDGIFRVRSQYEPDKSYIVNVNHGDPTCDCPDGQQRTINCKHRIASLLYLRQAQAKALAIYDVSHNSYLGRGRWIVTDHKAKVKYIVYRDGNGRFICPCNRKDCEHRKAIREYLNNNGGGNGSKIANECGSERAKQLQDKLNDEEWSKWSDREIARRCRVDHKFVGKLRSEIHTGDIPSINSKRTFIHHKTGEPTTMNTENIGEQADGQLDSQNNNGNGAPNVPSQPQLSISDPFQECEQLDIDQIEGRGNGELAHKLSNGEVVISYRGIMSLAEKHSITFTHGENSNTKQVIARARLNGNERLSGKLPIPSKETAVELAKRNAARQLLPLGEIKAIEKKARLEAEFDWQDAKAKCVELVGTDANVDIIIYELVKDGKLRQDNPSHYDRMEWLIIYDACKDDASDNGNDGGDNSPSSNNDGYNPNWRDWYDKCVDVSSIADTSAIINQVMNDHNARYRKERIADADWERILDECKKRAESKRLKRSAQSERAFLKRQYELDYIQGRTGFNVREKLIDKAFAGCSWNDGNGRLDKKFDGKPIRFEVNKNNPNWVTLTYPNGQVTTVHDNVMYESVLQST